MNNILATGYARYNSSYQTYISLIENDSTIIGLNAGINLLLEKETSRNVFLGTNTGQYSSTPYENIFIGYDAGKYILKGDNNIIIGREIDTGTINNIANILSLGFFNKTLDNSITIGDNNCNIGYLNFIGGKSNIIYGSNDIVIGNKNTIGGNYNIISGFSNTISSNNNIVIGSNNYAYGNQLLIGNNLLNNNSYNINIDNTLIKYSGSNNQLLFIGNGNKYDNNRGISVAIGYKIDDKNTLLNYDATLKTSSNIRPSLYVKDGIYTDSLILSTSNEYNIYITGASNLTSNVIYKIPQIPDDTTNIYLSTSNNGELYWTKAIAENLTGTINSDQVFEGSSNYYYDEFRFINSFNNNFNRITLDDISNGTSNKYIKNGIYNQDLMVFGTLTVNKLQVLGIDIKNNSANNFNGYIGNLVSNTSNDLINIINELRIKIKVLEDLVKP